MCSIWSQVKPTRDMHFDAMSSRRMGGTMIEREARAVQGGALADTSKANIGFVLSHEQFPVTQLVELGAQAEEAGFDCLSCSDHFQPWQANQGHATFAWATM